MWNLCTYVQHICYMNFNTYAHRTIWKTYILHIYHIYLNMLHMCEIICYFYLGGRTPPSFFDRAVKLAQKNRGLAKSGTFPWMTRLVKWHRAVRRTEAPPCAFTWIMSFRCWGLKPSGPPAEPGEKDRIAPTIISSEMAKISSSCGRGVGAGGKAESGCDECLRAWRVEPFFSARTESELASLTAPLRSPTSSLEETRRAKEAIWSLKLWLVGPERNRTSLSLPVDTAYTEPQLTNTPKKTCQSTQIKNLSMIYNCYIIHSIERMLLSHLHSKPALV